MAHRGFDLLLVSRDHTRLLTLANDLRNSCSVDIKTEILDLAQPDAGHRLFVLSRGQRKYVDLLVNNAGFGMYGPFVDMPLSQIHQMLHLHMKTVVDSTRLFLPSMIEQQSGAIINVSSAAGFFPIPFMAEYAATKAFLNSFSEALAEEVRGSGVTIQVCCPGYVQTHFHQTAGAQPQNPLKAQTSLEVVQASLRGLDKGKSRVVVGWQGRLTDFVSRFFPRTLLIRIAGDRVNPAQRR